MRLGSENNSIILLCNPADGLTTRNQGARKQFGIHNSQELTNLSGLPGPRSGGISLKESTCELSVVNVVWSVLCGVWRQITIQQDLLQT